jgi:hypothetical protein
LGNKLELEKVKLTNQVVNRQKSVVLAAILLSKKAQRRNAPALDAGRT